MLQPADLVPHSKMSQSNLRFWIVGMLFFQLHLFDGVSDKCKTSLRPTEYAKRNISYDKKNRCPFKGRSTEHSKIARMMNGERVDRFLQ